MKKKILKILAMVSSVAIVSSAITMVASAVDPDYYGTETEGCKQNFYSASLRENAPDSIQNSDFSQGFKYWINYDNQGWKNGIQSECTIENGALKVSTGASDAYVGVATFPFKTLNVSDGQYLTAVFKFKGDITKAKGQVTQVRDTGSEAQNVIKCNQLAWVTEPASADDWGWATFKILNTSTPVDNIAKNYSFWFAIESNGNNVTFYVDDIHMCALNSDQISTVQSYNTYKDIYTGKDLDYKPTNTLGQNEYGTFADGITCINNNIVSVTPTAKPMNLDFSEGLRYWGTQYKTGKASDFVKLIIEKNNSYIKLSPKAKWDGILTAKFQCLGIKEGDKIALVYDWKGSGDYQVGLKFINPAVAVQENWFVTGDVGVATTLYEAKNDSEWNVSMTMSKSLPKVASGETATFMIGVQTKSDLSLDYCFDNLTLVKIAADGSIKNLNGATLDYSKGSLGGSTSSGSSSMATGDNYPVAIVLVSAVLALGVVAISYRKIRI